MYLYLSSLLSLLVFLYESDPNFAALPTYPVVLAQKGDSFDVVPFGVSSSNKKKEDSTTGRGIPVYLYCYSPFTLPFFFYLFINKIIINFQLSIIIHYYFYV